MYQKHFGLERPPFRITPDTSLFFEGNQRGAALEALHYAIKSGEGIVKVIGEVGSGKTMLCRMLELRLNDDNVEVVYIANPSLSPDNILHVIAHELKLDVNNATSKVDVMQRIQKHLLQKHADNVHVVLFVEEAQSMPTETLEEIRLLSNLETDQNKLLQMVLFGQPELDEKLGQAHIRQLKERITHSFYLAPFPPEDILQYLNFRLRAVGYRGPDLFSGKTAACIKKYSGGLTRRINILADKALLAAFSEDGHSVTCAHIRTAAIDSEFVPRGMPPWLRKTFWVTSSAAVIASVLYLGVLIGLSQQRNEPAMMYLQEVPAAQVEPEKGREPVAEIDTIQSSSLPSSSQVVSVQTAEVVTPQRPVDESLVSSAAREEAVVADTGEIKTTAVPADGALQGKVAERVQITRHWLSGANDRNYSIQLFMARTSNRKAVEDFLQKAPLTLDFSKIYIYETRVGGDSWYAIVYDEFSSYRQAMARLQQLPDSLQASSPYLRRLSALKQEMVAGDLT